MRKCGCEIYPWERHTGSSTCQGTEVGQIWRMQMEPRVTNSHQTLGLSFSCSFLLSLLKTSSAGVGGVRGGGRGGEEGGRGGEEGRGGGGEVLSWPLHKQLAAPCPGSPGLRAPGRWLMFLLQLGGALFPLPCTITSLRGRVWSVCSLPSVSQTAPSTWQTCR